LLSFAAAVFAVIVGADELWVLDPDPYLEALYMDEGFSARTIYHGKKSWSEENTVMPDPTTEEGRAEIALRIKKRKENSAEVRKRAENSPEEEPTGKLTNPNDVDRMRDRKNEEQ
jgi:hypothetical protein